MRDVDNETISQVEPVRLGASFSPAARERVTGYLGSFRSFSPTLGLLYGALPADGRGGGSWSMTAFGPQTVDDLIEMYAGFGSVVCYEIDGISVVIPQLAHIAELEAGVLEFVGNRLRPAPPQGS
jgi:hypothetical protein